MERKRKEKRTPGRLAGNLLTFSKDIEVEEAARGEDRAKIGEWKFSRGVSTRPRFRWFSLSGLK